MGTILRVILLLALVLFHLSKAADFQVRVQDNGHYSVLVGGKLWLTSGPTFFNKDGRRWGTEAGGGLTLTRVTNVTSGGYVTNWVERQFSYSYGNGTGAVMTAIRTFTEADTVIFTQTFLSPSYNTSFGVERSANETISGFPSFRVADPEEPLGYLSYGGPMWGDRNKSIGRFTRTTANFNVGFEAGPLALFNTRGQTIVISPYDNFMAASVSRDADHVSWGIMGGVDSVPANFTYRTIIRFGNSINEAFSLWGDSLASRFPAIYDSDIRAENQRRDVSLNYLGYWTDKGAYYYYNTEANKTYETTIKDLLAYAMTNAIPYRYLQLDSWWYPKQDGNKGTISWTPLATVFPHGIKSLSDRIPMSIVANNRYWSNATEYATNYTWIMDQDASLPNDIEFWRYLFGQAKAWGLRVYEQDYLDYQTSHVGALQSSLSLGRDWLVQMGRAAAEHNMTLQYSRALPRHAYQSLEIPVVTQARVSDDFTIAGQWKIGVTSIFADALGIRPSKDTFWTNMTQPGNPYGSLTGNPALESAVATLSMGPVGPSDGIGRTLKDSVMACCRQDGTILKPKKPAKAIDKQIISTAFNSASTSGGEVWATYTDITMNGSMVSRHGVLLAADISRPTIVTVADFWFDLPERGVYFPHKKPFQWRYYNASTTFDLTGCSTSNFCLYHFSPILPNSGVIAILGDPRKWVPMATERISDVVAGYNTVTVTVSGSPGEHVPISFIIQGDQLFMKNCTVGTCYLIYSPPPVSSSTAISPSASIPTNTSISTLIPSSTPIPSRAARGRFVWHNVVIYLALAAVTLINSFPYINNF